MATGFQELQNSYGDTFKLNDTVSKRNSSGHDAYQLTRLFKHKGQKKATIHRANSKNTENVLLDTLNSASTAPEKITITDQQDVVCNTEDARSPYKDADTLPIEIIETNFEGSDSETQRSELVHNQVIHKVILSEVHLQTLEQTDDKPAINENENIESDSKPFNQPMLHLESLSNQIVGLLEVSKSIEGKFGNLERSLQAHDKKLADLEQVIRGQDELIRSMLTLSQFSAVNRNLVVAVNNITKPLEQSLSNIDKIHAFVGGLDSLKLDAKLDDFDTHLSNQDSAYERLPSQVAIELVQNALPTYKREVEAINNINSGLKDIILEIVRSKNIDKPFIKEPLGELNQTIAYIDILNKCFESASKADEAERKSTILKAFVAEKLYEFWTGREEFYLTLHEGIVQEEGSNQKRLKTFRDASLQKDMQLLKSLGAELQLEYEALKYERMLYDGEIHKRHGKDEIDNGTMATVFLPGWKLEPIEVRPSFREKEVTPR